VIEKRVMQHAACLVDADLHHASLQQVKYSNGSIMDGIPVSAVPVGSVEFVVAVMRARGIDVPPHISYPEELRSFHFLKRKLVEGVFSEVSDQNLFIKPRHEIKGFTGSILRDLDPSLHISDDYPVWISDPVKFVSEWRYYILRGKIVGRGRYDDGDENAPMPDLDLVQDAINACMTGTLPAGCAMDFGVLDTGATALIEVNDGWAIGYYKDGDGNGCSHVDYARLLNARWRELFTARWAHAHD
jgi:hypothetical protein